jgi:hypothetical protein
MEEPSLENQNIINNVNLFMDYAVKFGDLSKEKQALLKLHIDLLFQRAIMDKL